MANDDEIARYGWFVLALLLLLPACGASTPPASAPEPVERAPMQWADGNYIINLYDAFGPPKSGLTHHFGFSALIRYNGKTILFDSGTNAEVLEANTKALGIDLRDVDFAVASHAHFDHINGFDYLLRVNPDVKIYFPQDLFWGADASSALPAPKPASPTSSPRTSATSVARKKSFTSIRAVVSGAPTSSSSTRTPRSRPASR